MEQPIRITRYGVEVWETPAMDAIRRENCMCHHCSRMNPDKPDHCEIAQSFYEICKQHGNALILTRCDSWVPLSRG